MLSHALHKLDNTKVLTCLLVRWLVTRGVYDQGRVLAQTQASISSCCIFVHVPSCTCKPHDCKIYWHCRSLLGRAIRATMKPSNKARGIQILPTHHSVVPCFVASTQPDLPVIKASRGLWLQHQTASEVFADTYCHCWSACDCCRGLSGPSLRGPKRWPFLQPRLRPSVARISTAALTTAWRGSRTLFRQPRMQAYRSEAMSAALWAAPTRCHIPHCTPTAEDPQLLKIL